MGSISSVGIGIWECLAELFGRRGAFRQSQQKQTSMALGRRYGLNPLWLFTDVYDFAKERSPVRTCGLG